MTQMALIISDCEWSNQGSVVSLILEHLMAADRLGFDEMFSTLH